MVLDLHTVQEEVAVMFQRLQPWTLAQLVTWLDMRVAEYKVLGYMIFDEEYNHNRKHMRTSTQNTSLVNQPHSSRIHGDSPLPGYTVGERHRTTIHQDQHPSNVLSTPTNVQNLNTENNVLQLSVDTNSDGRPSPVYVAQTVTTSEEGPLSCNDTTSQKESNATQSSSLREVQNAQTRQGDSFLSNNQHFLSYPNDLSRSENSVFPLQQPPPLNVPMPDDSITIFNVSDNTTENIPHVVNVKSEYEMIEGNQVDDATTQNVKETDNDVALSTDEASSTSENNPDTASQTSDTSRDFCNFFNVNLKHVGLPTFDASTERFLKRDQAHVVWNKVVEVCAFHLLSKGNPAVGEYRLFCAALFNKYPAIGCKQGAQPWSKFSRCLSQKIRMMRHQVKSNKIYSRRTELYREVIEKGMKYVMETKGENQYSQFEDSQPD